MSDHGGAVAELVDQLGRLPGIGRKSAERLAFHLLRVSESEALALSEAIRRVRQDVHYCSQCFNLSESENCLICSDPGRDQTRLCIVEQPRDLMSLEQSAAFKGVYHVLLGIHSLAGHSVSKYGLRSAVLNNEYVQARFAFQRGQFRLVKDTAL